MESHILHSPAEEAEPSMASFLLYLPICLFLVYCLFNLVNAGKSHDKELEDLRKTKDLHKQEAAALRRELEDALAENEDLQDTNENYGITIQELNVTVAALDNARTELAFDNKKLQNAIKKNTTANGERKEEDMATGRAFQELCGENLGLQVQLAEITHDNMRLSKEAEDCGEMRLRVDRLQHGLADANAYVGQVRIECHEALRNMQARHKETLVSRGQELLEQVRTTVATDRQKQAAIDRLTEELKNSIWREKEIEGTSKIMISEMTKQHSELIRQSKEEAEQLQAKIVLLEKAAVDDAEQIETKSSTIKRLEVPMTMLQHQLKNVKDQLWVEQAHSRQGLEAAKIAQKLEKEKHQLSQRLAEYQRFLREAQQGSRKMLFNLETEISKLHDDNSELYDENSKLSDQLAIQTSAAENAKNVWEEVQRVATQLEKAEDEKKALAYQRSAYAKECAVLRENWMAAEAKLQKELQNNEQYKAETKETLASREETIEHLEECFKAAWADSEGSP